MWFNGSLCPFNLRLALGAILFAKKGKYSSPTAVVIAL
jgi:hypothetical protein